MDYDDAVHGKYGDRPDFSNMDPEGRSAVGLDKSPLDHAFEITIFPNAYAKKKTQLQVTLRHFGRLIRKKWAIEKEALPWFKSSLFGEQPTERLSLRHNANLLSVTGVEADYDAERITAESARQLLFNAGITAIVYDTPSSTPERPRWRVLAPFSKAWLPDERARFVARLNGIFGGTLDDASFTLSQSFYYGNVRGKPPVEVLLVEGVRYVDEADDLDSTAKWKQGKASKAGEKPGDAFSESEMLKRIWTSENFHSAALSLAGHWARTNVSPFTAMQKLLQAFRAVPVGDRDDRWSKRFASLDDVLRYVYKKQAEEFIAERDYWRSQLNDEDVPRAKVEVLSAADCTSGGHREYVIKGFLSKGDLGCIVGPPGVGKSLLSPLIAHAVSQGDSIFGMRTKPGPALYVAAEDELGVTARVSALHKVRGEAKGLYLVKGVSDLLTRDSSDLVELAAVVQRHRPVLVVIDTLAMAFPGLEENTAEGMGRVVAAARSLTQWGAAVLLIHHDTKDGSNGLPRGHSLLNGALDVSLHLKKTDGGVRGELTKNRNGSVNRHIGFSISVLSLGVDEDGDEITAAYCKELETGPSEPKLPPSAAAAFSHFYDLLENHAVVKGGRRGVAEDIWRATCIEGRAVSTSNVEDSRRKATDRAIKELMTRKKVEFSEGYYWIIVTAHGDSEEFTGTSEEELV